MDIAPDGPLDPDGCAAEPIRTPGAIQPHGWLLAHDGATARLVAYSDNCEELTGLASGPSQTTALQAVLEDLRSRASTEPREGSPASIGSAVIDGRTLDATRTRSGALVIVELEPASTSGGTQAPMHDLARRVVPLLQKATTVAELATLAAVEMKRLTGFGRALVYSFDRDGHGQVLAECADAGYDSYIGHSFPASDIPPQARDLYLLNHFRLIPDANYRPVGLHRVDGSAAAAGPLDLSFAQLRSVSPVHLEYMRNMGTLASMSVSIVVQGRLWGLVSCHDHAPHGLGLETRFACEHLGGLLALQIEAKEDDHDVAMHASLGRMTLEIVSRLGESDATLRSILDAPALLLGLARAGGAAVVFRDQCWRVGATPSDSDIVTIADWICGLGVETYDTDDLRGADASLPPGVRNAAGVLAVSLSRVHRHVVLWFRPEVARSTHWAGGPVKERDGHGRLRPRRSFESWLEILRGRSAPWSRSEIAAAAELRQALIGIVLHRAQERAATTGRIRRLTLAKELAERADAAKTQFLAVLAHELRTPLSSIASAAELIGRLAATTDKVSDLVSMIKRNVALEASLIDDLLDLGAVTAGKLKLALEPVDIDGLVAQVVDMLRQELVAKGLRIEVVPCAVARPVDADPVRMQQVLWNVVRNAVKFTPSGGYIRIASELQGGDLVVTCADSGIGIAADDLSRIFVAYQQASIEAYQRSGGLGLGLAIATAIVRSHGGQLEAASDGVDRGAIFTIRLPAGTAR